MRALKKGNSDTYSLIYTTLELHVGVHIGKSNTGIERPWGFQKFKAPRFQDIRHRMVAKLSAGRLYPPGNIPGTHFW